MLIKEYRIPLPLTVEEYRIAQLYMIAKKSRNESSGAGSGVEILINEPYTDGPGGQGQYTQKVYHVGSHLPGWLKGILPKTALMVNEEAWNAYPYTKTRYTCPFVEKFYLEIETYYFGDKGHQDNVFNLSGSDLRNRVVDLIDFVKDQLYGADYVKEEDPKVFHSEKSGMGPLNDNWLEEYWKEVQGKTQPLANGKALMCAYKLCRVEFRYWGMQTKIEKFIHDVALRKTMLRAHRQAWAWQDEWHGLTMEDIREIERQTQLALKRKMAQANGEDLMDDEESGTNSFSQDSSTNKTIAANFVSIEKNEENSTPLVTNKSSNSVPIVQTETVSDAELSSEETANDMGLSFHRDDEKWQQRNLHSPGSSSLKSFDLQVANWRIESLGRDSDSASDEEFFDCQDAIRRHSKKYKKKNMADVSLAKWSSLDLLTEEDGDNASPTVVLNEQDDSIFSPTYLQRVASERNNRSFLNKGKGSLDICPDSPVTTGQSSCSTTVLLLVLHAGSVLDANVDMTTKKSDVTTFKGAFESVVRQHYPTLVGHFSIRLVSCPSICTEGLSVLSSLSPYSFDVSPSCTDTPQITHDSVPIGAIPLLATATLEYQDAVTKTIIKANNVYQEFLKSEEGLNFSGQIVIVSDSVGSILAYDVMCRANKYQSRHGSENSIVDQDVIANEVIVNETGHLVAPPPRRRSSSTSENPNQMKLDFDVSECFMFGSPLALVLAYRRMSVTDEKNSHIIRPACHQMYNLFHPTDPVASRLEPLLSARFSMLPPVNVARYAKYPLGDGQPHHLLEFLQSNPHLFNDSSQPSRRLSEVSIQSTVSGVIENISLQTISSLQQKWWGNKRLDYALYCPEGLSNFPTNALPHLFHASYWESSDVIAFILRQVAKQELTQLAGMDDREQCFKPGQPREKWMRKRTSVKLKNVAANHRANDVIVKEGASQTLTARFMYGPLDMITLTGEKVDIHIMKDAPAGEWSHIATEVTDKTGRITYTIPDDKSLGYGLYPVKMVVRGDHTSVDFFLAVVPPKTECVVFSIDGSFTASVSVTGRDPKVRAGAVDVVRHWQELGYLIVYITGRPDMQQQRVVSWLSQHNFPHGLVSFADGLSTDPLGHKAAYLNNLVKNHGVIIHSAYGSGKDISVYTAIGLKPKQIYIVGKANKKQQSQATILAEGYAAHLAALMTHGGSRPAQGNARMVIPRGYFGLPGQSTSRRRRSTKRTTSYPTTSDTTSLERSLSTRRCQLPRPIHATIIRNHSSTPGT